MGFLRLFEAVPNIWTKRLGALVGLDRGKQEITSAFVPLPNKSWRVVTGSGAGVDETTTAALISAADGGNGTSNASPLRKR